MSTTSTTVGWGTAQRRALIAGTVALVLSAAVGFGSGRSLLHVGGPGRVVDAGAYSTDALVVFFAVATVGAGLLWYILQPTRRRKRKDEARQVIERPPVPWTAVVVTIFALLALIAGLVTALALLPHRASQPPVVPQVAAAPTGHGTHTRTTAGRQAELPPAHWWVLIGVAGVAAAGVAFAAVVAVRRRRDNLVVDEPASSEANALQAAIAVSLDEIEREPDPRRAVIKAYARMESGLADVGVAPRRAETPIEYVQRTLRSLALSPDTVSRLTQLFERARFSSHIVAPVMKDDAIAALRELNDELKGWR